MEQVSIRLDQEQINQIDQLAEVNGISRSEQVRECINTFLGLAKRIEKGEFLTLLPSIEPERLDLTIEEAGQIIEEFDHDEDNYFNLIIPKIVNALKFNVGVQLVEQNKDDLIDFGQDYVKSDIKCHLHEMEHLTKKTRG